MSLVAENPFNRQRKLRALWVDMRFADFDHNTGPTVDSLWPCSPA